jgi:hypothetical protein
MAISCIIVAGITLVAGRFYLPFFLVAGTFLFLALIIFAFRNIFMNVFIVNLKQMKKIKNAQFVIMKWKRRKEKK